MFPCSVFFRSPLLAVAECWNVCRNYLIVLCDAKAETKPKNPSKVHCLNFWCIIQLFRTIAKDYISSSKNLSLRPTLWKWCMVTNYSLDWCRCCCTCASLPLYFSYMYVCGYLGWTVENRDFTKKLLIFIVLSYFSLLLNDIQLNFGGSFWPWLVDFAKGDCSLLVVWGCNLRFISGCPFKECYVHRDMKFWQLLLFLSSVKTELLVKK